MRLGALACIAASLIVTAEGFAQSPGAATDWPIHSMDRPVPPVVSTGRLSAPVPAPSDAIVLFDGKSLDSWQSADSAGAPARWKLVGDYMEVAKGTGNIHTKRGFGD